MDRKDLENAFLSNDKEEKEIAKEYKAEETNEETIKETESKEINQKKKTNKKTPIIICVCAILIAIGGFFAWKHFGNNKIEEDAEFNQGEVEKSTINYFEDTNNNKTLAEWQAINSEVIGILKINGKEFPVCYGQSQEYYLRRDVWGNYDIYGTMSLDENSSSANTPVKIIYGHSTTAYSLGLTFISKYFKDSSYYSNNDTFIWEDNEGEHTYKVLAGLHFENGNSDYMDWYQPDADEIGFDTVAYAQNIVDNANVVFDNEISSVKPFMLLATCDMNTWIDAEDGTTHRYVLVAQELSDSAQSELNG